MDRLQRLRRIAFGLLRTARAQDNRARVYELEALCSDLNAEILTAAGAE